MKYGDGGARATRALASVLFLAFVSAPILAQRPTVIAITTDPAGVACTVGASPTVLFDGDMYECVASIYTLNLGGKAPIAGVQYVVGVADPDLDADKILTCATGIACSITGGDDGKANVLLDYSRTIAADPGMTAENCEFTVDGTGGGGFICEGADVDTFEQLYLFPLNDGADSTNFMCVDDKQVIDLEGTNLSITAGVLNATGGGADGLGPDGDKGDITVGGTGTTLIVDDDVVAAEHVDYITSFGTDPGTAVSECFPASFVGTGGGFVCEGSVADAFERLWKFPDVQGTDDVAFIVTDNDKEVVDLEGTGLQITAGVLELTGGSGDVVGPAASIDNQIARYSGTTGKLIQDYTSDGPTVSDTGFGSFPNGLNTPVGTGSISYGGFGANHVSLESGGLTFGLDTVINRSAIAHLTVASRTIVTAELTPTSNDNEIARFGAALSRIQGYTSGGPTISDVGLLNVPVAGNLTVTGTAVCLSDGTDCPADELPLTALADLGDLCGGGQSTRRNGGDSANECFTASAGGATAIDDLADAGGGDDAVALADQEQTWTWNTETTAIVADGLSLIMVYDPLTADSGEQVVLRVEAANGGNDAVGTLDALLAIRNRDSNDQVGTGIQIRADGGGMGAAINANDPDIVEILVHAGGSISSSDFDILNDGVVDASEVAADVATQAEIDLKADLASPALTGDPTVPTAAADDNDTSAASTGFVQQEHDDSAGSCTAQFVRAVNATAAPTCATVAAADVAADVATQAELDAVEGMTRTIPLSLLDSTGLLDADDLPSYWRAPAAVTITEIWCETDDATGTPSVNFQRDDGSPANICTADLDPTTGGATCTVLAAEDNFADGQLLDFVMVDAQSMNRLNCHVEYTVD